METRLVSGVTNRWTLLLTPCQRAIGSDLLSLCKSSRSRLLTLCRGQSAIPYVSVPEQQEDCDEEATAFLAAESFVIDQEHDERVLGHVGMKVATPLVTARVGQLAQNGISTCLVFSRSIARAPETRFSQDLVATRFAAVGRRKLPSALAFTAERGDIHHLSGTIESWELPGDGPFLFPIDAQAKLGLIKGHGKEPVSLSKTSLVSTSECTKMPRRN